MNQIWCIPTDCVPFLAAATSWDQLYINLGNKFLSDTTDKILTQIRDLIELDEPSINQDLLIANVSEKIFYDYRSINRNVNETYEEGINEVYNQYKNIISSRAASGDMPDQCVKEIVCTMEQFKNRLLARAGKNSKKYSKQITKNLLDNKNPVDYLPNIQTIVNKINDQEIQSNEIEQQEQINFPEKKKINSSYYPTPLITKHKSRSDYNRQEISNTFIPFTDCTDYDPYRNYAKYKEKRLYNNKNVF